MQVRFFRLKRAATGIVIPGGENGMTRMGPNSVDIIMSAELPFVPAIGSQVAINSAEAASLPPQIVTYVVVGELLTMNTVQETATIDIILSQM